MNEFHSINATCSMLVPSGPGYENASLANQVCSTVGAQPGQNYVEGNLFANLSFGYYYSNLWRVRVWTVLHNRSKLIQLH
jgi:ATP-binding cassette subfamily G (WHITE) protein 2 (SNQ2)